MNFVDDVWYGKHPLGLLLSPLSGVFCAVVRLRRWAYRHQWLRSQHFGVPIIVVGNLTVGGTGKTPLVIWLVQFLRQQGYEPAVISRGYGGQATQYPFFVNADSSPDNVGDEAILLARYCQCPVAIAPQRLQAIQAILETYAECNIIISDDGLQHYAMQRDIEILVLDDVRRFGNQRCLPAGPLRESVQRKRSVDFIVSKGVGVGQEIPMRYDIQPLRNLSNPTQQRELEDLRGHVVHAVAGIGHPTKFFNSLRDHGLKVKCHTFPDHHRFGTADIDFNDNYPVIMTEKDAVKCQLFADERHWCLPITARLPNLFGTQLLQRLAERTQHG